MNNVPISRIKERLEILEGEYDTISKHLDNLRVQVAIHTERLAFIGGQIEENERYLYQDENQMLPKTPLQPVPNTETELERMRQMDDDQENLPGISLKEGSTPKTVSEKKPKSPTAESGSFDVGKFL